MADLPDVLHRTDDLAGVRFELRLTEGFIGERKVRGMLRLEPDALLLEYEMQDNAFDKFIRLLDNESSGGKSKSLQIPLLEVEKLTVESSFFSGTAVELRTIRLQSLDGVPGAKAGVLRLPIAKAEKANAQALVSRAGLLQSEQRLRKSGFGE